MHVLVFNVGSSSVKIGVFRMRPEPVELFRASFDRFRDGRCDLKIASDRGEETLSPDHASIAEAIAAVPALLSHYGLTAIDAVGHRMVHGGSKFARPALLDEAALQAIEALNPLAPLHNPASLKAIRLALGLWPALPQVAVFDTSFHLSSPPYASTYAVPKTWRDAGLRRYGFHGTSHKYVSQRVAQEIGLPLSALRIVSFHLGNGASVCAIDRGRSLDNSMGMTPLEGLVMGTRSGDLDPGAAGFLSRQFGLGAEEVEAALYRESGLLALGGSSDMRDLEDKAAAGDADAQLAIEVYAYRARKYLGAYAAAMGGLDAVVFTGGIGENSAPMRRRICEGLEFMGVALDPVRNEAVDLSGRAAPQIQAYGARVRVFVTETAEQLMIARETAETLGRSEPALDPIPVAVSARHVHLSQETCDALFGKGVALTIAGPLRQPGNWVAAERVTLEGPKGRLERVAILGPLRSRTQVEVSRTDSFALGVDAPVRDSGRLDGTPKITLIGPAGKVVTDGLIIASRHIHTNPQDGERLGLEDGELVDVRVGNAERGLIFERTLVRVGSKSFTEMHIDTDEANAAGIGPGAEGEIVEDHEATIHRA